MSSIYFEDILLRGFAVTTTADWTEQHIITQGFYGLSVPSSAIPFSILEILISSVGNSISSYFPQWMNLHYSTDPVTGSLLRRFLYSPQKEILGASYYTNKVEQQRYFNNWLGEPWKGWTVTSEAFSDQVKTVVVKSTVSESNPRRCISEWDFTNAIGPAYIVDDSTYSIYFRHLDDNIIYLYCTEFVDLANGEILKGQDIYWSPGPSREEWYIIPAGDTRINYATGVITLGITGYVTIVYPSKIHNSYLSNATVSVNGGPALPLTKFEYWNSLDEVGLLIDVPRLLEEDNISYWGRLSSVFPFPGSSTEDGLKQAVGRKLNLMGIGFWDGLTTLSWGASSSIEDVWVNNVKQYSYITGYMGENDLTHFTTKRDISLPYIFNGNTLVNTNPVSGIVSGDYSNQLVASYKYSNYTVENSGSGISYLKSTSNTLEDIYRISWNKHLKVNTLNRKKYKNTLIDPNGTPSSDLLDIADNIRKVVDTTLGYVKWEKAHWFTPEEVSPQIDYIPIPMDF